MELVDVSRAKPAQSKMKLGGESLKKPKTDASQELAIWIANTMDRKGAKEIVVIETKPGTFTTDYLVVATGTSSKHMQTLLEAPCNELKKLGFPAQNIEGEGSQWMLADLGDIVIHIFDQETRGFFDIESLWDKAPRIEWENKKSARLKH